MIRILALYLLRRHIPRSTYGAAFLRQSGYLAPARAKFGQAKIHDLGDSVPPDHDVFRFDVAVDDAFFMRRRQPIGDLYADVDGLFEAYLPMFFAQGLPAHEL